jgi:hypothetical protein
MKRDPYTFVSLSLDSGEQSRLSVSFHTGDMSISASAVDSGRPYLSLSSSEATVTVSTIGAGPVTDGDLAIARRLHNAAARYLADCERLYADQTQREQSEPTDSAPTAETAA